MTSMYDDQIFLFFLETRSYRRHSAFDILRYKILTTHIIGTRNNFAMKLNFQACTLAFITTTSMSFVFHDCSAFVSPSQNAFPHHPNSAHKLKLDQYKWNYSLSRSTQILMGKGDDSEEDITSNNSVNTEDKKKTLSNKLASTWRTILTKLINVFPTLRVAIASFTVGAL